MNPDVDIMNSDVLSTDDPVCNEKGCDSEESFVTDLDESSPLTEKTACLIIFILYLSDFVFYYPQLRQKFEYFMLEINKTDTYWTE